MAFWVSHKDSSALTNICIFYMILPFKIPLPGWYYLAVLRPFRCQWMWHVVAVFNDKQSRWTRLFSV